MYAKRIVPILLTIGVVHMLMRHGQFGPAGHCAEGEPRGFAAHRGEWGKRVPPLFEKWHTAAHAQESQPAASTPAACGESTSGTTPPSPFRIPGCT